MLLQINLFLIILILKTPMLGQMGVITFGGVAGYSAGYAIKKFVKIAIFICGLLFVLFQLFSHYEILTINWVNIQLLAENIIHKDFNNLIPILTSHLPATGGFLVGFTLGLKKG